MDWKQDGLYHGVHGEHGEFRGEKGIEFSWRLNLNDRFILAVFLHAIPSVYSVPSVVQNAICNSYGQLSAGFTRNRS